jgi:branched-subunit amino acid aminotransferase/4-amino-4-deoxychorismate lyase
MRVIIDGHPVDPSKATISVFDWGLLRGDGIFEAVRSYGGRLFQLDAHLTRLQRSAALMRLELPDLSQVGRWATAVGEDGHDCTVRILVTRGGSEPDVDSPSRVVVLWEPVPDQTPAVSMRPTSAPWHSGGLAWELMGAKTLSYAANMSAWRAARAAGFDDALLITRDGHVLEGPTFSIGWVVDGIIKTPSLDLGILASITRMVTFEEAARLGLTVDEGRFTLDRVLEADEVFALSTLKEVKPVDRVGVTPFAAGPVTGLLAAAYRGRVEAETS